MAAQAIGSGAHLSLTDLLDHFHLSASNANILEYFGCFYSPSSRFLGTDAEENWNVLEFYEYSKPHFDAEAVWTYIPRKNTRKYEQINSPDGVPLFATFDELLDSESFGCTSRGTGTAIFDAALKYWFLISYHLSFPTPNDLAREICKKIDIFEKKNGPKVLNRSDVVAAELLAEFENDLKEKRRDNSKKSSSKKNKSGKS